MRGLLFNQFIWLLVLFGSFGLFGCAPTTPTPPKTVEVAIHDPYATFPDETFLNKTPNPPVLNMPLPPAPRTFRTPIANPEPSVIQQLGNHIQIYDSKMKLADLEVAVEFVNPRSQVEGAWDYGILFRMKNLDQAYRVYMDSDGEWGFGYGNQLLAPGGTLAKWNSKMGEVNELRVIALGKSALFFVNDYYVSVLDVSAHPEAGTIAAGTGILPGHSLDESVTKTRDFRVWRMQPEPTTAEGNLTVAHGVPAWQKGNFNHPNFIAHVTFVNPHGASKWDYGLALRLSGDKHYLAMMLTSDGKCFGRFMTEKDGIPISYALPEYYVTGLKKGAGEENEIVLYAYKDNGVLLVNGQVLKILDFSDLKNAGDVRPLANGMVLTRQTYTVPYKNFTVVPIP